MTGEDILEALNRNIESRRRENKINTVGHLVLLRTIKMNSTFKAYKTYEAIVYFVSKKKKYRVLSCTLTANVLDGQEESMLREMNIMLSTMIFNWIGSDFYEQVINGEYNGIKE